ncbi:MAG: NADH-quinone oxidoreductase subunit L [Burkholderiales bacterium]|nr:NADH-quinone oxidoreductase subunit L [Burkholderiales bacterium]
MKHLVFAIFVLAPAMMMLAGMLASQLHVLTIGRLWRVFLLLSGIASAAALLNVCGEQQFPEWRPWLMTSVFGSVVALLVQLLGTLIAAFSSRYLDGEPGQRRYVAALAGVLAAVHLLVIADHWVVLIAAWALVGVALQHLLCFYPDRPFAMLAAHKKRIADRIADGLLIGAAAMAWRETGSGSLSGLWSYLGTEGMSTTLQLSAVCLVLAVILRTALLPVHGWLIQVMEAPTPVSALLHAGVVNLGGYVLIRFAPLLEQAMPARSLLLIFGLGSAVLAGLVMLTRISIKVRLAWSTAAQMGFMVLECGLGLYTLAALHLIGHSLYKAHAFLSASMIVRQTRLQTMRGRLLPTTVSLLLAPVVAIPTVLLIQRGIGHAAWPWWWSVILGLAWAPLLWLPSQRSSIRANGLQMLSGFLMLACLTCAALLAHALPLGICDAPNHVFGVVALIGMAMLYLCLVCIQRQTQVSGVWRRWSYAGFYLDEIYTRIALQIWPARWTPDAAKTSHHRMPALVHRDAL